MSNNLKKGISIFTSITTILWLSGVAMLAPMTVTAQDIVDGDIVSPDAEFTENGTTYYPYDVFIIKIVGDKTFKRLILNPEVFESYGHLKWENIKTISADTVAGYTTSDLVYPDTDGDGLPDGPVYKLTPDGDTGTKQHLDMTPEQFVEQGYDWDSVYVVNSVDINNYTEGTPITVEGDEEAGTLTVGLAADTPASAVVPKNAARVPFTKITLTATGGDVTIDSLTIERTGLAQDSNFSSVCVIDADTNEKIGLDKTLNSSHQAVLNDDIVVESGTTKNLILAGNMASSLQAGETPSLSLASMTLKGDATLNADLPVTGNVMTMNNTITIASVTLGTGPSNPSSDNNPKVGQTDVNFTEIKITNTSSTEKVEIEQIKWTQYGSAGDDDIENLDLVDSATGEVLATLSKMDNKVALYKFDSPLVIDKGKHKNLMIRGDTVGGSGRTVDMSIEKYTDILVKGQLYGFYVTPTAGTGAASSEPYINGTAHTIGTGSLKVSQASISSSNIAEGATQQVLGAFDFTVKGEPITISKIGWMVHIDQAAGNSNATTSDITNLTVYDADGNVVCGPKDPTFKYSSGDESYGVATTTDSFTVPVGTNTYTVKADLSTDFDANDTIQISITPGANITAKGDVTGKTVTATPSTEVTSVTQTVKTGALSVSLDPSVTDSYVVKGTNDYVFAKLVLDATGSGEDINVTQIQVTVKPTTASSNELSNFRIYDGDTELSVTNDSDSDLSSTASAVATSTFSLSETLTIPKGSSKTLTVKANISRSCSSGDVFKVGIGGYQNVTATGATTGSSITPTYSASDGATITIKDTGELTIYASSATPKAGLIAANTSGVSVGVFNVSARYEDVNIEKIYFTATSVNSGGLDQVATFYLYDGDTQIASVTPTSSDTTTGQSRTVLVDMSSSPLTVSAGTSKDITIKVDTSPADRFNGLGPGTAGQGFQFSINAVGDVTAKGVSSGTALSSSSKTVSCTMKQFTVYKSVPTVTLNNDLDDGVSSGSLTAGTETGKELYKFKVAADEKGDIGIYQVAFLISTSTATVTNFYLEDEEGKVATFYGSSYELASGSTGTGYQHIHVFYFTDDGLAPNNASVDSATDVIPYTIPAGSSKTFTLKANVECDSTCQSTSRTGTVQVQFLGSSAFPGTYPDGADDLNDDVCLNSFIWGDYNITLGNSSTTASTSEQWTNAYRVASGGGGTLEATSTAVIFTK